MRILLLLKNNFMRTLNINKLKRTKVVKLILYALLAIYVLTSLFFSVFLYANLIADALLKYGLISYMLILFFIMAVITNFTFSIQSSKSSIFNSDDNDMLFSLPIKSGTILASRLIITILWNLLTSLIFLIPALIVYALKVHVGFEFYIFNLIIFIFLPIIPTVLASVVGYLIAYFTSKSNKKNFFEILISLFFIFAIYYLMYSGQKLLTLFVDNQELIANIIKYAFYPIYIAIEALTKYNYLYLLEYILINVAVIFIFVYILQQKYKRIVAKLQENRTKSNYSMKELKSKGQGFTLITKEIKRYFSSPIYVLNTIFGVVLFAVFSVATIFMDKYKIVEMLGFSGTGLTFFQLLFVGLAFIIGLSVTTSVAVSMEGKNYWIIKTLPIDKTKYFNSKIFLNMLIVVPMIWLSIIVLKFSINLTIYELIILFVFTVIMGLFSSLLGLIINLIFPKMNGTSDVDVVKRSLSVIISVFAQIALVGVSIWIYSLLGIDFNIMIYIVMLFILILTFIEKIVLNRWGKSRLDFINN